ncbi:MAG: SDR family NAD(P)-dependent oxidoreductase [Pseudomonadales bacterium]
MNTLQLFSLDNKCVLVTGASSGLGEHFARLAAAAGASVALTARRVSRLDALVDEINGQGGRAFSAFMDVAEEGSVGAALEAIEREFQPIDVLANNAGIAFNKPFLETDRADWKNTLDTNVIGLADVARQTCARMVDGKRGGSIINVGSILGARPGNMVPAYGASKAAVIHLSRGMALELARHNIRVNALLPGYIETDLTDMKNNEQALQRLRKQIPQRRTGEKEDLDGAFLLLASDASRYMTGSTITVDGGHSSNSL